MKVKGEKNRHLYLLFMWALLLGFLLVRFAEPMKDGDVFWHIKYGEYHVQNKTMLVDHSIFSWTPATKYVPYCTWAADVLLYFLFQAGGWPLLYIFMYVCLFFPVVMAWLFARKAGVKNYVFTFFILIVLQLSIVDASFVKPEILSLTIFAVLASLYFYIKLDYLNKNKGLLFFLYPLFFLIWANMHGVFFFGLIVFATIIAGETVNYLMKNKNSFPQKTLVILIFSGLLSAASTLMTPYGIDLFLEILKVSAEGVAQNVVENIRAFQPVTKNLSLVAVEHNVQFWGIMVVSFLILFFVNAKKNRELDFGIILPTLFLSIIFFKYLRASYYWPPFWSISIFYLCNRQHADLITDLKNAKPKLKGILIAIVLFLSIFFPLRSLYNIVYKPPRYSYIGYGYNYGMPVQESAFLKKHGFGNKIFNSYNAGSFLIFDLYPDRKIFIDNRYFPFKNNIFEKYMAFRDGQISLKEMEDEFGFDTAIITNAEIVLNTFLKSKHWRPVYYGIAGVVLVNDKVNFYNDIRLLDHHRFDGVKNLVQAATIVRTAQNLNDLDTADYVINIMKENLSNQSSFDFFYPYCTFGQKGLRAFEQGDINTSFDYLWKLGFNDSNIRSNSVLKVLINMKIKDFVEEKKYQDALTLIGRLFNYYRTDEDIMYDAGVIAYLAEKQAKTTGLSLKLPSWREVFKRLLVIKPDYLYASIAKKLLSNENISEDIPLVFNLDVQSESKEIIFINVKKI